MDQLTTILYDKVQIMSPSEYLQLIIILKLYYLQHMASRFPVITRFVRDYYNSLTSVALFTNMVLL